MPDALMLTDQSLILGLAFATIVLIVGGFGYWFLDETPLVRRRLKAIQQRNQHLRHVEHREGAFSVRWVEPVAKLILPEEDWRESRMRSRLVHAGYRSRRALFLFAALKVSLAVVIPLLTLLLGYLGGGSPTAEVGGIIAVILGAVFGFYVPDLVVGMYARDRQRVLREDFPDCLDLLVVCVEAGLSMDAAIQRVSKELEKSHPELGLELGLVTLEMKAGKSKEDALRALADRTGLPEIQALSSILIQSEHFGTSVAASLSEHADEMRRIRIQKAREKAAKLPVTMTFPIMFFIFPALFLVLLGPAMINIVRGFSQVFGGYQ